MTYSKRSAELTYELLNAEMKYDPDTGVLTWKRDQTRRYKAGMEIGGLKTRVDDGGKTISYRYVGLNGQQVPAARVAWLLHYGEWPKTPIVFKDGDGLNLRISNLKESEFSTVKYVDAAGRTRYKMPREQARRFGLKRYYGMTWETYNVMLSAQNGVCDICKGQETYQPKTYDGPKALSVDHNHTTNQIRGLLCSNCNYLIGHCKEDPEILRAAAKYLEKHAAVAETAPKIVATDTSEELH